MSDQLEKEIRLLKLKERKREKEQEEQKASEGTGTCLGLAIIFGLFWIALLIAWIKIPDNLGYFLGFIFLSAINLVSMLIFRHEWRKQSKLTKKIKAIEKEIKELENPSRKVTDMSTTEQLIYYINLKESLRNQEEAKSKAISWVISGIKSLAIFVIYLATEKHLFQKEIEQFCLQNPNYKYVINVFTIIAFWGFGSCIFGIINYFIAKNEVEKLKRQVRRLERELIAKGQGQTKGSYTRI